MYIFANLFVSLIYESFSNIYLELTNKAGALRRQDIRSFKAAWAVVDPLGTGYIQPSLLPQLLKRLQGGLSMNIYDEQFSIKTLMNASREPGQTLQTSGTHSHVNLEKFNEMLGNLPIERIRSRKRILNKVYEEVNLLSDPRLGVSFSEVLLILVNHKIINLRMCLRYVEIHLIRACQLILLSFREYWDRKLRLRELEERLQTESFLRFMSIYPWTRRLRKFKRSKVSTIGIAD